MQENNKVSIFRINSPKIHIIELISQTKQIRMYKRAANICIFEIPSNLDVERCSSGKYLHLLDSKESQRNRTEFLHYALQMLFSGIKKLFKKTSLKDLFNKEFLVILQNLRDISGRKFPQNSKEPKEGF